MKSIWPLLCSIFSKMFNARWPEYVRTTYPIPTTSQTAPPQSSAETRRNGSPDCGDDAEHMFWLSYELSLEREAILASHLHELRAMPPAQLLKAAERICIDWHVTKNILRQHVTRVAELECKLALHEREPIDERFYDMARELRKDL